MSDLAKDLKTLLNYKSPPRDNGPRGNLELQTSRGKIEVRDSHIFEIIVPESEDLVLTFRMNDGSSFSFRVGGMPQAAKEKSFDGKDLKVDKSEN